MTSSTHGASTFQVEVTNIDRFGFWLLVEDREYFLPYQEFPWFRKARVEEDPERRTLPRRPSSLAGPRRCSVS